MAKVVAFTRMRERKLLRPWKQPRARARRRRPGKRWLSIGVFSLVIAGSAAAEFGFPAVGCDIKGNISQNTGERIYHVRGQEYYHATRIDWLAGERWFCSESAARAAGWRRARV
jgi:hypothetical protein